MTNVAPGLRSQWLLWIVLAIAFACVLVFNVFCIPAHDELSYAFLGQSTPLDGFSPRVSSFADIVRQQCTDYMQANGRVFVHSVVAYFAGFRLYYLFDLLNTIVWFLFVYLVLDEAGVKMSVERFVRGSLIAFAFWWYSETVSMNSAFGFNYLWMACATMLVMKLWRNIDSWLWTPLGFVYGWGQEVFSLPMTGALMCSLLLRSIKERRYAATAKQTALLAFIALGSIALVMSPGARSRAARSMDVSLLGFAVAVLKLFAGLALAIWPIVLLLCIALLVWNSRRRLFELVNDSLEWWMFFAAAFVLSLLTCTNCVYRTCSGWFMAGMILMLRHRRASFLEGRFANVVCIAGFAWMVVGAAFQISYGVANMNMLRVYAADEQGVTYREVVPPALWNNVCWVGTYNAFHLNLFRQEYHREVSPIILSGGLYKALYQNPSEFFKGATMIGDCYYNDMFPDVAVKKGSAEFSEELIAELNAKTSLKGLKRFLPGRTRKLFPSDTMYVHLPSNPCSFVCKDGGVYTVYKIE